ncbi:MAG: chemotaxis protein CheW [Proteobacteria bacterium]|nr:chemotaxis protein CheW [Pseudomonadota bacterium]MBU1687299.1 chemotaxis protein CheW [Pseudomonadota bacterium]
MVDKELVSPSIGDALDILVFSINDCLYGIDGTQVGRMVMLYEAEQEELPVRWFHQSLTFGHRDVDYRNPRVITLSGGDEPIGLIIDHPRDLVRVAIKSICPLPSIFAKLDALHVFWGGTVLDGKIVLLVDLFRLLR